MRAFSFFIVAPVLSLSVEAAETVVAPDANIGFQKAWETSRTTNVATLFSQENRERWFVRTRAAQLIGEEMTRQELRVARKQTQVAIAKKRKISQDGVSRLSL